MDKVIVKDLIARGIIGINDWEREKSQEIKINLILFGDLHPAGRSDQIEDCINYRTAAKKAQMHAETANRFTVEALAADIARICLEDPRVKKVIVRVEKPGAVRFADSVGVEIERTQTDFEE